MPKKSILFIADRPDWAYHNITKTWQTYLKDWDCFVAFSNDYLIHFQEFSSVRKRVLNLKNTILNKDFYKKIDASGRFAVPTYRRNPVYNIATGDRAEKTHFDAIVELAYYFQYTAKFPFTSGKKLVGIYTDSFPHEGPHLDKIHGRNLHNLTREEFFDNYLKNCDGIVVGNTNLLFDYQVFTDKIVFANGIYKQDEFVENPNVGKNIDLKIGWTGNPKRTMKGYHEVIEPAVKLVKKTGRKISLKTRFSGDYSGLLDFYTDVDLVCIASEADTGPSLFSEASLSKVPCITTEIGFPKMAIINGENGIFVNRNIDEMAAAIIKLYDNRELLQKFSARIKDDYLAVLDNKISAQNLENFLTKIV